jgi:hypothetical protein
MTNGETAACIFAMESEIKNIQSLFCTIETERNYYITVVWERYAKLKEISDHYAFFVLNTHLNSYITTL